MHRAATVSQQKSLDLSEVNLDNIIMNDNLSSSPALVGAQIRTLRRSLGWSLAKLARRAATSAPSIHRYESGWDRFQIYTLRKIARALGARLEIRLVKEDGRQRDKPESRRLVPLLKPLFWDKKLNAEDLDAFPVWVMCRVLMFGNLRQVRITRGFYGDRVLKEALASRTIDPKTRNFWTQMLEGGPDAS